MNPLSVTGGELSRINDNFVAGSTDNASNAFKNTLVNKRYYVSIPTQVGIIRSLHIIIQICLHWKCWSTMTPLNRLVTKCSISNIKVAINTCSLWVHPSVQPSLYPCNSQYYLNSSKELHNSLLEKLSYSNCGSQRIQRSFNFTGTQML